jgi:hypothetical protein
VARTRPFPELPQELITVDGDSMPNSIKALRTVVLAARLAIAGQDFPVPRVKARDAMPRPCGQMPVIDHLDFAKHRKSLLKLGVVQMKPVNNFLAGLEPYNREVNVAAPDFPCTQRVAVSSVDASNRRILLCEVRDRISGGPVDLLVYGPE